MADYANDVLVEPEWLEQHLDDDSIRIVEVDENPALYREAHIPGAIGFDWRTDLQDQVRRDFLGPGGFRRAVWKPRNLERSPGDPLRRSQQLVCRLHVLVPEVLRARQRQAAERPARALDHRRPARRRPTFRTTPRDVRRPSPGDESIRAKRDEVLSRARRTPAAGRRALPAGVLRRADLDRATSRRARSAPATSRAPSRSRGHRRSRRTARSSRPTSSASSTAARAC